MSGTEEILYEIRTVKNILTGGDYATDGGVLGRLDSSEKRITSLERWRDKSVVIIWSLLVPSIVGFIQLLNLVVSWVKA